jgi:signal peptidase I
MIHSDSVHLQKLKPNPVITFFEIIGNIFWLILLVIVILRLFVYQQVQVDGLSMYPNYNDREMLLMNQLDKSFNRGQVVAVYAHRNFADQVTHQMNPIQSYFARFDCNQPRSQLESDCKAKFYLKRIIGLPNEEIEIVGGTVIIYNQANPQGAILGENYIPESTRQLENMRAYYLPKTKIPANEYFLMGDNRRNSMDSREVGTFVDYAIFGQENLRFTPLNKFSLPSYTFSPINPSIKEKMLNQRKSDITIER